VCVCVCVCCCVCVVVCCVVLCCVVLCCVVLCCVVLCVVTVALTDERLQDSELSLRSPSPVFIWKNNVKICVSLYIYIYIFMHLSDAFIQSDLQCIQAIHFLSVSHRNTAAIYIYIYIHTYTCIHTHTYMRCFSRIILLLPTKMHQVHLQSKLQHKQIIDQL